MVLLDTNIVSAMTRTTQPPELFLRLAELARDDVHISAVTVREVLYGLHRRGGMERKEEAFEQVIERYGVLPFDLTAARICADLIVTLEADGMRLDLSDMEIAAIALAHNLALITGNTRHFRRIPGLRVYNWLDA